MKKCMCLLALASLIGPASTTNAQPAKAGRALLVGTWRFVSANQQLADGTDKPDPQTGARGVGFLIYTETGQMCAVIANPDRPRWRSASPTDAEVRAAFEGLVAYCGSYEVNVLDGYVVHHIEMDREPNLAGSDRKRYFSISGNRLVLRPAPPLPPGVREWAIVWERVGQ